MQNIPVFTTENGVASLTLKEIPYTKKAYITLQNTQNPDSFLQECVDFCRAVGALQIYATGHIYLEKFPLHTTVCQMHRTLKDLPVTDAFLVPVQEGTIAQWQEIYNKRMQGISNAAYLTMQDAKKYLQAGSAYFVYNRESLLGIGIAAGDTIAGIASVLPGAGRDVLLALMHSLSSETVFLEVASDNLRAIGLYKRLSFQTTKEISRWYQIFKDVK